MEIQNLWMFALAGLLLNLTPGNDMLYVASRSTGQGTKAGIVSAFGIMGGCFVHAVAAVAGLSAIIAQSAITFNVIKYVGALYLIYLGLRAILKKRTSLTLDEASRSLTYKKIFWQGVTTNVLNPKVGLFFLAFLPQFINVNSAGAHWQILFLGTWFNVSGLVVNFLVAVLFGKVGNWLSNSPGFLQWQERISGTVLIALGIKVALTKPS